MRPAGVLAPVLAALGAGLILLQPGAASESRGEVMISVPNVPGPYCMYGLEKRLVEMPEVASVQLHWQHEAIQVKLKPGASVTREQIEAAIERAEYPSRYSIRL